MSKSFNEKKHPLINMKLGGKFIVILCFMIFFCVALVVIGIRNVNHQVDLSQLVYERTTKPLIALVEMQSAHSIIKTELKQLIISESPEESKQLFESLTANNKVFSETLETLKSNLEAAELTNGPIYKTTVEIIEGRKGSAEVVTKIVAIKQQGKIDEALEIYNTSLLPLLGQTADKLTALKNKAFEVALEEKNLMEESRTKSFTTMLIILAVAIILCLFIYSLAMKLIVFPINLVKNRALKVAEGQFDLQVALYGKDEIGDLSRSIDAVSGSYLTLLDEMKIMLDEHMRGEIDYRIDETKFKSTYRDVIEKVNGMVESYIQSTLEILSCVEGIGKGNFDMPLVKYPGKKAIANTIVESLRSELKKIVLEVNVMVDAAKSGELSKRSSVEQFEGDWKVIMIELNDLMNAVSAPISESSRVLQQISNGNLKGKVEGNYQGDFSLIKNSVNNMLDFLNSYIGEISSLLVELSNNNIALRIDREYIGDFAQIKTSFNQVFNSLNGVVSELNSSVLTLSDCSGNITQASSKLASGALTQTSSVENLNNKIIEINEQTNLNAEASKQAESISSTSKSNAEEGNNEMHNMLSAMEKIKDSSNNIFKIIKVIEDIAFQTNLLALNAAVEAARAGAHGKGFAVVAEEVRNLAARSQQAVRETTELIEDSIVKVDEGSELAKHTAEILNRIVGNVSEVSGIIKTIADSSDEQAASIRAIRSGIQDISNVTDENSRTAQDSLVSADELISRSKALNSIVSSFKARR